MKTIEEIKYLLRLSGSKLVLLNNLLESTREQTTILDEEREEELLVSLEKRQEIINKIDILDKEFLKEYNQLKDDLGVGSLMDFKGEMGPELKGLQDKISQIIRVSRQVQDLDRSNIEKLKISMEKVQGDIRTIRNSKKVTAGYKGYEQETHSFFLDKKR